MKKAIVFTIFSLLDALSIAAAEPIVEATKNGEKIFFNSLDSIVVRRCVHRQYQGTGIN
jgi:hypothetical protein